jgi:hypothetical protein
MKIFVDFDKTICPNGDESIPPSDDCLFVLNKLFNEGHDIIIYSIRSNSSLTNIKDGHDNMIQYLDKYRVPYSGFNSRKPHYNMIIDDRCAGIPLDKNKNVDWSYLKNKLT